MALPPMGCARTLRDVGFIGVSNSAVHRIVRVVVGGLFVVGVLFAFSGGRTEALTGSTRSGYAYGKPAASAAPETARIVNASATRDDDGTSPVKVLVIVSLGVAIVGGAVFEGIYVRRRGLH
jgi:hypothetical protein